MTFGNPRHERTRIGGIRRNPPFIFGRWHHPHGKVPKNLYFAYPFPVCILRNIWDHTFVLRKIHHLALALFMHFNRLWHICGKDVPFNLDDIYSPFWDLFILKNPGPCIMIYKIPRT